MNIQPQLTNCRHFKTSVGEVVIDAVEMGKKQRQGTPTFVLVHGLGMSASYFMPTAELLAASGTVFAPDLPGFGKSTKPARTLAIPELADSLAEWIAALNITSTVVIGNSLGAQVIVDLTVRHHSRLAAAVLVGPTIDPAARRLSTQVGRLLSDIPREPFGLYGIAVRDYFRAGLGRCLETLRHALEDPVTEKLPAIRVPVLVVRGEHDPIAPQRWTEQAAELIPHSKWVTVPDAAHAVNFSAAEQLVKEVLEFCSGVSAVPPLSGMSHRRPAPELPMQQGGN